MEFYTGDLALAQNSDNDLDGLTCGRSSLFDKISCGGEVAAEKALEFIECMTGVSCFDEVFTQTKECIEQDECIFELSSECLGVTYEENDISSGNLLEEFQETELPVTGNVYANVGFHLKFDPKEWTVELTATGRVRSSLAADLSINRAWTLPNNKKEKPLTKRKKLLMKKVFMLGKVPVLIEIHMQPYLFLDLDLNAAVNANLQISNTANFEQKVKVDIDDGWAELGQPSLNFPFGPVSIDELSIDGEFNAATAIRTGPRISVSVYKIPTYFDVVAIVGADLNLQGSASLENACISGSASMNVGVDARVGTVFNNLDPIAFARTACEEATAELSRTMNMANTAIDRAQCFTDILDIDTSEVDDAQASIDNLLAALCDEAIDFLVPPELQQFSCQLGAATEMTADWIELASFKPKIAGAFCTDETVTELDTGMSNVFSNLQAACA